MKFLLIAGCLIWCACSRTLDPEKPKLVTHRFEALSVDEERQIRYKGRSPRE